MKRLFLLGLLVFTINCAYPQGIKHRGVFSFSIGPTNTLDNAGVSVFKDATNQYHTVSYDFFAGLYLKGYTDPYVCFGINYSGMPCYTSHTDKGELFVSDYIGLHLRLESPITDKVTFLCGFGGGMLWGNNYYTYLEEDYKVRRTGIAIPVELGITYAVGKFYNVGVKGGLIGGKLGDVKDNVPPYDFVTGNKIFTTQLSIFVEMHL